MDHLEEGIRLEALFLSPHPDDVELFCGGTVARLAGRGRRVMIADLTAGELSTNGDVPSRRRESQEAARALGLSGERPVLGLPDGGIDPRDDSQLAAVVELIRRTRPRWIFAPFSRDRHPDHEAAGELARRAGFFAGVERYQAPGTPHRPDVLAYYPGHHVPPISFYVDVSASMEQRRAALRCHRSQFTPQEGGRDTFINRPGFLEGVEARLRHWGSQAGVDYAEAFVLERPLLAERMGELFGG